MADTKRFYWLKLKEDFFRQKEIKKLRRIAGGDTFTIIYLKMLLRSLKDGGRLYYEGIEENFASELALDIDEDEDNVKVTVSFLIANNILTQNQPDEYELLTAHEMTDSECDSAARVRRLRAQRALSESEKALQCNATVTDSNVTVTMCNTEIDIDKRDKSNKRKSAEVENAVSFALFWNLYPRKVSKATAAKAWTKLKPDDSLCETILADVRRRIEGEWNGKDEQYIPHPTTYLNQRRWEDEHATEAPIQRDMSVAEILRQQMM